MISFPAHPTMRRRHLLPISLLCLLFLTQLPRSRHQNPSSIPSDCQADIWLIGHSESSETLDQFLLQFPHSQPPSDVCILFLHPHAFKPHIRNVHTAHPPTRIESLYTHALLRGAKYILAANDDTFFDTTLYGTGKGDVTSLVTSFKSLLPHPTQIRAAPHGVANSHAILSNASILSRAIPRSHLRTTGGYGEAYLYNLPKTSATNALITSYLTHTPDTHADLSAFQREIHAIYPASDSGTTPKIGLFHGPGSLGAVANPSLYAREAAWLLPLQGDVHTGWVGQRALWEAGEGVVVAAPGLDVWKMGGHEEGTDDEVFEGLERLQIPRLRFVDEVYLYVMQGLCKDGVVRCDLARRTRQYHSALARLHIPRLNMSHVKGYKHEIGLAKTAVCVSGQMRSAPLTHRNLLSTLHRAVGKFDVMLVTARDDRAGAARLFKPTQKAYSTEFPRGDWVQLGRLKNVHESMGSRGMMRNYIRQLWDMRRCLGLIEREETRRGRRYEYVVRIRPDVVFTRGIHGSWWRESVVHGKRHSYYGMNDRMFAGPRRMMGRLLTCHDVFEWVLRRGRKGQSGRELLFRKKINSERFLARCARWKNVSVGSVTEIDVRRVAWSLGRGRWREF